MNIQKSAKSTLSATLAMRILLMRMGGQKDQNHTPKPRKRKEKR
jgi:hypothetical protein